MPSAFSNPAVPPQPGAGGMPDQNVLRSQALYPLQDPTTAMMNVMRDMGYNPFRTNPMIGAMLRAAPGLASLWQLSNIGANANDISANGGADNMFGQFLQGQLQNGTAFNSLRQGAANMGNYTNQLTDLQNRLAGGNVDVTQIPVFLDMLENTLNNPQGFAQTLGSMMSPMLGKSLGQSYQNTLGLTAQGAERRQVMDPSFGQPNMPNFYDFIMGRR